MLIDVSDIKETPPIRGFRCSSVPPESTAFMLPLLRLRHFNRHRRSPSPIIATTAPRAPPTTAAIDIGSADGHGVFVGDNDIDVELTVFEPAGADPVNVSNAEAAKVEDN